MKLKSFKNLFVTFVTILFALLIISLPLSLQHNTALAETVLEEDVSFEGGDGTESNPYGISTPEQLNAVRDYPDAHFILINDIDMSAATSEGGAYWNDGAGWEPIAELNGSFNGMCFELCGLYCANTISESAGVFAANNGCIYNLGLIDVIVQSDASAGGIVVTNRGTITNCYTTGKIIGSKVSGGICAITTGDIVCSYNAATVTLYSSCDFVGGIAGKMRSGSHIEYCYNTGDISVLRAGNISGIKGAGGIVGRTSNNNDLIKDCFNTGSIYVERSSNEVGGIASYLCDSELKNCYNVGLLGGSCAGISPWVGRWSSISGAFYLDIGLKNLKGAYCTIDRTERAQIKTHEEMIMQSTFEDYDFTDAWKISEIEGYPYPVLKNVPIDGLYQNNIPFDGGTGLLANPYVISTAEQLNEIRNYNMKFYILSKDIDLDMATSKGGIFYNEGQGFDPIDGNGRDFFVRLDGNEHTISGLKINRPDEIGVGLFGSLKSSYIKNLKLIGVSCIGKDNCGAIAGQIIGDIENCIVCGQVAGTGFSLSDCGTGGIVGSIKGTIMYCTNYASVSGYNQCGGIGGWIRGEILRSGNHGSVIGTWRHCTGGISGSINGTIMDCYNTANIVAQNSTYVGGITGWNYSQSYNLTFVNCYSTGKADYGITACKINPTKWSDCYYLNTSVKYANQYGIAKTETELKQQTAFQEFDFENIWTMGGNPTYFFPELQNRPMIGTYIASIIVSCESDSVIRMRTLQMNTEVLPADAHNKILTWSVENGTGQATIDDNGLLKGTKAGNVTVKATANDGSGVSVTKTITIIQDRYTVTFNSQGGDAVTSTVAEYNTTIADPALPMRTGYDFRGWFKEPSCNNQWDFSTNKVTANTTLFAKWIPVPSTPSVTATSASYSSIKISWSKVSGASGYKVYRATSSNGTYTRVYTATSGSTLSYTNTSLTTGKTYYYKVRAYHLEDGAKVYSSYSSVKSAKPIPATPSGVKAARASSTSIKVSWSSVSGATGYEVYRATSKTGTYTKVTSTTSKSYTNTGRTKGKTYYYKVRAYRTVNGTKVYGSYSSVVSYKL